MQQMGAAGSEMRDRKTLENVQRLWFDESKCRSLVRIVLVGEEGKFEGRTMPDMRPASDLTRMLSVCIIIKETLTLIIQSVIYNSLSVSLLERR